MARSRSNPRLALQAGLADGHHEPSEAEREFLAAIETYKLRNRRPFPTWNEVVELARSLGRQRMLRDAGRRRLLIVEDHRPTRDALRTYFLRRGWEVMVAGTVPEGMSGLDDGPWGEILELTLPDGGGEAILRQVREEALPIRVVIYTNNQHPPAEPVV